MLALNNGVIFVKKTVTKYSVFQLQIGYNSIGGEIQRSNEKDW